MITLSEETYKKLKDDERLLEALYAHGVDNWSGWDDAIQEFFNERREEKW